ncbi:MAG: class I SAM-dependent methyltransferase [bacterium]
MPIRAQNVKRFGTRGQIPGLLRFQKQDAACLEFETGRFDLVVSQHIFHHIAAWQ